MTVQILFCTGSLRMLLWFCYMYFMLRLVVTGVLHCFVWLGLCLSPSKLFWIMKVNQLMRYLCVEVLVTLVSACDVTVVLLLIAVSKSKSKIERINVMQCCVGYSLCGILVVLARAGCVFRGIC